MIIIIIYNADSLCYAPFQGSRRGAAPNVDRSQHLDSTVRRKPLFSSMTLVVAALAALLAFPALAEDAPLFKLVANDGVFTPALIEVPAGKRVTLEVTNAGKTPMEFESRDLKQEKVIPPGGKATLTLRALKAGEYKFVDEFHEKTGQGKLIAK
jgi:plastocyanin